MGTYVNSCGRDTMRDIVRAVASKLDMPVAKIMGRTRPTEVVEARQIAMFLCREAGFSLPEIGTYFERDHTTVLHNVRTVEARTDLNLVAAGVRVLA